MDTKAEDGVADRVRSLSDRQREVLRLVSRDHGSKEIARELGLSDETVKNHIKAAMAKLGSTSRYDAARLLRLHERGDPLVVSDPARGIAGPASGPTVLPDGRDEGRPAPMLVREERATFDVGSPPGPVADHRPARPSGKAGSKKHGLTGIEVVGWIALTTAALAVAGIAAAPLARSAQDIANLIERPRNAR